MKKAILIILLLAIITLFPACNLEPVYVAKVIMYISTGELSALNGKELYISPDDVDSYTASKGSQRSYKSIEKLPLYLDKRLKKPSGYFFGIVFAFDSMNRPKDCDFYILNAADEVIWDRGSDYESYYDSFEMNDGNTVVSYHAYHSVVTDFIDFRTVGYDITLGLTEKEN